jgi:transcriptional regulator with XRE-family HTH domain
VYGDPSLGALLQQVRESQGLTRSAVAARVSCDRSMVSRVEDGSRGLKSWLARDLDRLYGTGTMITTLAGSGAYPRQPGRATLEEDELVLVELPLRGVTMPISRRAVLAALSIGTTASALPDLQEAAADVPGDEELLAEMAQSLAGLHAAGRVMPPARLIDPLLGQVAVLDVVRRRAPQHLGRKFVMLQTQYAETLGWMTQESGDLHGAAVWVDRAQHWAQRAGWPDMVAYTHVRRSALAGSLAGDGTSAGEHAANALHVPDISARIWALAAKQAAYGYALSGRPDACKQALDQTVRLVDVAAAQDEGPDPSIALFSLDVPGALAQFRGTCDVYLGGGEHAIPLLESARTGAGPDSRRQAVNEARLARAYAQAGDPDRACALALDALDTGQALDSAMTRAELGRALAPLGRWPGREDVAEVRHRITTLA